MNLFISHLPDVELDPGFAQLLMLQLNQWQPGAYLLNQHAVDMGSSPTAELTFDEAAARAAVMIGILSDAVFSEKGDLIRRQWNRVLLNRQTPVAFVHYTPLAFVSHVYVSVRRYDFTDWELSTPPYCFSMLTKDLSNTDLVRDFERFTYTHTLRFDPYG